MYNLKLTKKLTNNVFSAITKYYKNYNVNEIKKTFQFRAKTISKYLSTNGYSWSI